MKTIALLLFFVFVASRGRSAVTRTRLTYDLYTGLMYGLIAVVGMRAYFELVPGVKVDPRMPLIALPGMVGGPLSALIAAAACVGMRILMGGAGTAAGIASILVAAAAGTAFAPSY